MRNVKASGEISIRCGHCGCEDSVLLDSLTFVPQEVPNNAADGFQPIHVATHSVKCPSCDEVMEVAIEVRPTSDGKIDDFNASIDGCVTDQSEDDIRSMIEIE